MSIERVTLLDGHIDQDTAYLVDDYPYGFRLRCKIRYWVETAYKRSSAGMQRFVSQTTNPKLPGESWNKPKATTYAALVVMYLDSSDYVRSFHVNGPTPVGHACFQLMGLHEQLGESMRARYDRFLSLAQRTQSSWNDFDATVAGLVAHIERHGQAPALDNNVWTDDHGRRHYLADAPEVYLALARRRAGEGA